jgi:putative molybdopterin biosynthesis protein
MLRQRRLGNIVSDNILEVLSLGYTPQELEATFYLQLARWREERQETEEKPGDQPKAGPSQNTINIVGSHDLALNILIDMFNKRTNRATEIKVTNAGSLGGLIALQEERADLAGIHLLDEETMEYNYPYVKHIFPGREIAIVHLAYRVQGLMFARNNPKQIRGIEDLKRPDIVFVNRQKGSGTRVLLDLELRQHGIMPSEVNGYEHELDTHMAVAIHIARGKCDVGLGIEAAARACEIDFLPLFHERYDLVMPTAKYHSPLIAPLLEIIATDDFRRLITSIGGYDTAQTGSTSFLN